MGKTIHIRITEEDGQLVEQATLTDATEKELAMVEFLLEAYGLELGEMSVVPAIL